MSCVLAFALLSAAAAGPTTDPAEETVAIAADRAERMTVPVSIAGKGPFPFVVDTGAERTVVSRELAEELKLVGDGNARVHSMSETSEVGTVIVPSLRFSARPTGRIRAPALARRNIGAAGMIGLDSLQDQRILIDFKSGTMTIAPSSAPRTERRDRDEIVVTARRRHGQLILVDASFGGSKVHAFIDTGSQVSVGNLALRRRLLGRTPKGLTPVDLISVTGGITPADYTTVREMRLSGVTFTDMPIAFADAHPFERLGLKDKPALLIGMDALKLFDRVSVDFANRKVRFLLPDEARRDDLRLASVNGPIG